MEGGKESQFLDVIILNIDQNQNELQRVEKDWVMKDFTWGSGMLLPFRGLVQVIVVILFPFNLKSGSGRVFLGFRIWPKCSAGIGKAISILTNLGSDCSQENLGLDTDEKCVGCGMWIRNMESGPPSRLCPLFHWGKETKLTTVSLRASH